jgi:hypothetical protein
MKRIKLNFAVAAILLGSVIAVTQSAFTPIKPAAKHFAGTIYDFNGSMLSQDKTAANYSAEGTTPPDCDEVQTLPCRILVPEGQTLQGWLDSQSNFQDVVDHSIDQRD